MDLVLAHYPLCLRGGAEQVAFQIAKKFNPVIYTTIYSNKVLPEFDEFDVRIINPRVQKIFPNAIPGEPSTLVSHMSYLYTKLRGDYDVLNASGSPAQWLALRNPRVSWYYHAQFNTYDPVFRKKYDKASIPYAAWNEFSYAADKWVARKISTISVNSGFAKTRMKRFLGREDVCVLHPGVDIKEFGCQEYSRYFLYVSRITQQKRIEYAIDAFRLFGRRGWKLKIVGTPMPGHEKYLAWLKDLASGCDVEFDLTPSPAMIKSAYASCYAALFCGADEAWGLVPLEAMASSKPVISVNEGGPTESILHGKTGFLVSSPGEMAAKMRFLADRPDVCEKMGRAGRRHVEQNYTWKIFLDAIERIFKQTAKM